MLIGKMLSKIVITHIETSIMCLRQHKIIAILVTITVKIKKKNIFKVYGILNGLFISIFKTNIQT